MMVIAVTKNMIQQLHQIGLICRQGGIVYQRTRKAISSSETSQSQGWLKIEIRYMGLI